MTLSATPARLATIRRDLAEIPRGADPHEWRTGYVAGLMLHGEWGDEAIRAVVWERPDAGRIIEAAKAWLKENAA